MRRLPLVPTSGPFETLDVTEAVWAEHRSHPSRPWVMCNMIASLDGAVTVYGRSGALSGPGDRALFHALRGVADVILVGAGTARTERYGVPSPTQESTRRRAAAGLRPRPRLALVTASLHLPAELPLFSDPDERPLVFTTGDAPTDRRAELVDRAEVIEAGATRVDVARVIATLSDRDARIVLCEGGPQLLGGLHDADLIDEWCVTISPLAVGGSAARIGLTPEAVLRPLHLDRVWEEDGMLFLRHLRHATI